MVDFTEMLSPAVNGWDRAAGWAASLTQLMLWRLRSASRSHLRRLEAHQLDDVGLDAETRQRECARWFWQA